MTKNYFNMNTKSGQQHWLYNIRGTLEECLLLLWRAVVEWLSIELWIMMTQVRFSTRAASKKLGNFSFTPHCPSSLSCINEYLAIDSDGLCERIVYRAVIAARLNASQRSWTCVCTNRSARGVIVSALNGQVDWILHVKHLTFYWSIVHKTSDIS